MRYEKWLPIAGALIGFWWMWYARPRPIVSPCDVACLAHDGSGVEGLTVSSGGNSTHVDCICRDQFVVNFPKA